MRITKRIGARIGILGNPSDGFYGKTISCMVSNFMAEVWIEESRLIQIVPHPRLDPFAFADLGHLSEVVHREGYYGGMRLLLATCKRFLDVCFQREIQLDDRNFALGYSTTIPRHVGLAGSSAIVTGAIKALMEFYGLTEKDIPREVQPGVVLSVEREELDIPAGLQDRVIQVYGGLVAMDLGREIMEDKGHGHYEPLDINLMPAMYLAYDQKNGSDSGRVHRPMRTRWESGDDEVVQGMSHIAELAHQGKAALTNGDYDQLARLMDDNFRARLKLYGEEALGEHNLRMISIARNMGLSAKFAGSGGAIIGVCQGEDRQKDVMAAFVQEGFDCCIIEPAVELALEVNHGRNSI